MKEKKKSYGKWIVIGLLAIVLLGGWTSYNGLVNKEETVIAQWAQVENVYERKYKLIPNLVSTVQEYTEYEGNILKEVTEARSKASSVNISADELTPENMKKFQEAQSQLSGSLSRLLATFERYPDLKANTNYQELMKELEGSENRITVERRKFNESVKVYNASLRKFPTNVFNSLYGFEKREVFKASEEAAKNDMNVKDLFDKE